MAYATAKIKKWGHSLGILIPKEVALETELSENDIVNVHIVKKKKISGFGLCRGKAPYEEEEFYKEID